MSARRQVRVSQRFFDQLDDQLGYERASDGLPSATDFLVVDLPPVVEIFATAFDGLPLLEPGREEFRVLVAHGRLVGGFLIIGRLVGDSIELIGVELDLG